MVEYPLDADGGAAGLLVNYAGMARADERELLSAFGMIGDPLAFHVCDGAITGILFAHRISAQERLIGFRFVFRVLARTGEGIATGQWEYAVTIVGFYYRNL